MLLNKQICLKEQTLQMLFVNMMLNHLFIYLDCGLNYLGKFNATTILLLFKSNTYK